MTRLSTVEYSQSLLREREKFLTDLNQLKETKYYAEKKLKSARESYQTEEPLMEKLEELYQEVGIWFSKPLKKTLTDAR